MSNTKSIEKLLNRSKNNAPWDEAIAAASQQIKDLKKAVKVYEKHRDAGEEWPGFKRTAGTDGKSAPANGS